MKIPEYFAKERMATPRYARPPAGISDEGGGIEARAIAQFGVALGQIGRKFQQAKDITDVTEAQTSILESFSNLENQYAQDQDYATMLERWNKDSDKLRKSVLKKKGLSGQARRAIEQRFDRDRVRFGGKIRSYARIRQIDQGRAKFLEGLEAIYKEGGELAESKAIALIEGTQSADYITAETAQKYKKDIPKTLEWYQIERLLYTNPDVVPEMIDAAEHLDPQEKNQLRSRARTIIASKARAQAAILEQQQEQTGRGMLIDFWEGKLTDVNEVTRALAANLITETKAEALRKAILDPDPPKTDLKAYAECKEAVNDIGRGAKSIDQALEVIYGNLDKLDPTTGKSLVDKIFGEHDKNDAEMFKEGRDLMEELIRDKDLISGMFTDDERQILGTAEAIVMLDAAIERAAREGKPLKGKELLIEAISIGRTLKRRVKEEKEAEKEPAFRFERMDVEKLKKKYPEVWEAAQKTIAEGKAETAKEKRELGASIEEAIKDKAKKEIMTILLRMSGHDRAMIEAKIKRARAIDIPWDKLLTSKDFDPYREK